MDAEEGKLVAADACKSDDQHVVALASVSGCRVVYSHDGALHGDLTNTSLLTPKCKIYQDETHVHLLYAAPPCG